MVKDFFKIVLYLVGSALLSALAAPWLFHAGTNLGKSHEAFRFLAEADFQRYFNRSFLIAAVILLFPLFRSLRIRSIGELGLAANPLRWRDLAFGFGAALGLIWVYGAILLGIGVNELKDPLPFHRIPSALWTAAAVSVVEEVFFRGALLGVVSRTCHPRTALFLVSALYSILHFLKPPEGTIPGAEVVWSSGFALLPLTFSQFAEPMLLLSGFTTLFLLGWIFGESTRATRSLWLAIGLHAGAILGARSFSILVKWEEPRLPWVGENLMTGLGPLLVLGLLLGVCQRYWRGRNEGGTSAG